MSETPAPGIYRGIPFSEYATWDAVHHSTLEHFRRTPAHAREAILHEKEPTQAKALGHAFHEFLLEPERFALDYVIPPKVDRRTKIGKETWATFEAEHPHAIPIAHEEAASYVGMRESILAHETARELLTGRGASEVSLVWLDAETGRTFKARVDRIGEIAGYSFLVDVKTTKDASERSFQKDISNYGYHRQLAEYRDGLFVLRPAERRAALIAVEKEPPYAVACYELDERALEQGRREYRHHLGTYLRCVETGLWPGYDAGLQLIDLPPWAVDRMDLEAA